MRVETNSGAKAMLPPQFCPRPFVGRSALIEHVREVATGIAQRQCTVMVLGETGTGKEMLARLIHEHSNRASKPFIPVDSSSLSDTLFESEMFGHVRGAFTGAVRDSLGFFRSADGGTLFLDEIGELSLTHQAKLLRVIQERTVVPVGQADGISVDVRIICATHRDLEAMVKRGEFRQDLYFRLNVVVLNVPPLRERTDDVIPLAEHFLKIQASLYDEPHRTLSAEAAARLICHAWPGNVRELANVIEHAHVLCRSQQIELANLPEKLRNMPLDSARVSSDELLLVDVERRAIAEALRRTRYNKTAAARLLGIAVQKLNRRIMKLGIRPLSA